MKTAPAAAGGGMLGYEDRMSSHGCLLPIFWNICRSKPFYNNVPGMLSDRIHPLITDIVDIFFCQLEFIPEVRGCESFKDDFRAL